MVGLLPSQLNTIIHGDALARLRELPDGCIQCCVTSPPYFGLRDYGIDGQIGLEETPDAYIQKLVEVFREVRRVLKDDGVLWVNIGDSYASSGKSGIDTLHDWNGDGRQRQLEPGIKPDITKGRAPTPPGCKPKDLIGIPWMLAFALRADGWYLRMDCIWHKPNCMPESVKDRPTKSHEYLFLLSKSERYYYDQDAVREPQVDDEETFYKKLIKTDHKQVREYGKDGLARTKVGFSHATYNPSGRNRRSVWSIATKSFSGAHFAVMPEALVEPCILAGTSPQACEHCGAPWERVTERGALIGQGNNPGKSSHLTPQGYLRNGKSRCGTNESIIHQGWQPTCTCPNNTGSGTCLVLDPFSGAGTVCLVAAKHGRSYLGIELNAEYIQLATTRLSKALGMWQEEVAV